MLPTAAGSARERRWAPPHRAPPGVYFLIFLLDFMGQRVNALCFAPFCFLMRAAPSGAAAQSAPWVRMIHGGDTTGFLEFRPRNAFLRRGGKVFPQAGRRSLHSGGPGAHAGRSGPARAPVATLLAASSENAAIKPQTVCPLHTRAELASRSELFTLGSASADIKKPLLWETLFLFFPGAVPEGSAQGLHQRESWGSVFLSLLSTQL